MKTKLTKQTKHQATLYPKDEITLPAIGYYTYMDPDQIQRLAYPTAKSKTATKRLSELAASFNHETTTFNDDGFLSYGWIHDKASPVLGRPKRFFFITPKNLKHIEEAYKRRAKHHLFKEHFADANIIRGNAAYGWARNHIEHELKLTDYALALNNGRGATRLFWERTSPQSQAISRSYTVNKLDLRTNTTAPMTVRFNPDSVDVAIDPSDASDRITFYLAFTEIDRGTENINADILQKIYGFDELIRQRHVQDVFDHYVHAYGMATFSPALTDTRTYRINTRIRFVTTTKARRNDLIRVIAQRSRYPQIYHVTTFDQIIDWDTFYTGKQWYVAGDYDSISKREVETQGMRAGTFNAWLEEQIDKYINPLSYFYRGSRSK